MRRTILRLIRIMIDVDINYCTHSFLWDDGVNAAFIVLLTAADLEEPVRSQLGLLVCTLSRPAS